MTVTIGRIIGKYPDGVSVWTFCELEGCVGHASCRACWAAWCDDYLRNERLASFRKWAELIEFGRAQGGMMLEAE